MHVTFISITYDFQWYENVTVELLILHWFFSCEFALSRSKNRCDLKDITKPNDTVSCNAIRSLFRGHTIVIVLFPQAQENVWPPVRYANIYTSFKKTSVYINLKYHTVSAWVLQNVKIRERSPCLINSYLAAFSCHIWMTTFLQLGLHIFLVNKRA